MNCNGNCRECIEKCKNYKETKCITVSIVGTLIDSTSIRFSSNHISIIRSKDYLFRFIDLTGKDKHVGLQIIDTNPDIVLNTIDATNLEDSLRITTRLIDLDSKVVMALTGYNKLLETNHSINFSTLGKLFSFPVTTIDNSEESLGKLLSMLAEVYETPFNTKRHIHVHYGQDIDKAIDEITPLIATIPELDKYHDRYLAVRLLEDRDYIQPLLDNRDSARELIEIATRKSKELSRNLGAPIDVLIRNARHGFIHGALQESLLHSKDNSDHTILQKIDSILTSKWLGFPVMILILFAIFEATFTLGAYPQRWIENGIDLLIGYLTSIMTSGWFSNMLIGGIVQGVGAVLAFLPNIIILFFFLSLLEDSGYMSRAAYLMDKIMHRIGLHGNSFVPMLLGFGCNVPAIMAARSIDNKKDRILTMLMIPFMSCSARLPVYLLFVSAFFAKQKALVMISIYLMGILTAILFAFIMKKTEYFKKNEDEDYVSELPPFRKPTWRNSGKHIWERVSDYLKKISTVILAASVIIWALEYFPSDRTDNGRNKEESYLAMIGKSIEPVMKPLGFDWKMNVCLLTGLPAKEAIVSTMGILYHTDDNNSLIESMKTDGGVTAPKALAFMVFVLLYFPCIATIATLNREAGRKWAIFSVINSLILAWVMAFLIFQIGSLL